MLSNDTKNIIDDARDTLVGQIPVPMMQCQQITLALTYKFMSDDDQQAVELGGQRHYFAGDLEGYEWDKIMSRRLDDTQRSELYRAGLNALQDSESLPAVFREIFKDAVVPFGDHRTLALFLNTMNRMGYDDSEKLGDAYEYLLRIAEAQADAGQFRTPRHIIDFIVNIINPQKHEVVIDPACGTAGFLVSAYQHVKNQHRLAGGGTTLSTPDLTRLADNLKGYDISPEMNKLAMANLYLHTQNKSPKITNYDTLTSTDHWNEHADVLLANPPFMTPKGGINPHTRFRVHAKRAEVLFVDYIASHLNEYGRAGIIVPEGIVFQSQNAYRQLRRLLLDESLVAVISLPSGIFNPYSGVKTSILILDKVLAPKTDRVAFFKAENDGYDLGSQRRPIGKDDLPTVTDEINEYLRRLRNSETMDGFAPKTGLVVEKERIAKGGDYNLSGERYRVDLHNSPTWPMVGLGNCIEVLDKLRRPITKRDRTSGPYPYYGATGVLDYVDGYIFDEPLVLVGEDGAKWGPSEKSAYAISGKTWVNNHAHVLRPNRNKVLDEYLIAALNHADLTRFVTGVTVPKLNQQKLREIQIPLPPLEVQQDLVAEIEGYQRAIDGAEELAAEMEQRIQYTIARVWEG